MMPHRLSHGSKRSTSLCEGCRGRKIINWNQPKQWDGSHTEDTPQQDPPETKVMSAATQRKSPAWAKDEYKMAMIAHFQAKLSPEGTSVTKQTYRYLIWQQWNQENRLNIDEYKLANDCGCFPV